MNSQIELLEMLALLLALAVAIGVVIRGEIQYSKENPDERREYEDDWF